MSAAERRRTRWRGAGRVALAAAAIAAVGQVRADEDAAYCARVRARASEDAAVLLAPRVFAEGFRLPSYAADVGPTVGDGYQVRVGLALSPLDMLRATGEERVAGADCRLHAATARLERIVESPDRALLPALRAEAAVLESHRADWTRLMAKDQEALRAGAVTLVDLDQLRRAVSALERRLEDVRGQADRLARAAEDDAPLAQLAASVGERSMELERESSRLRALDAFQLRVSGGAIPWSGSATDPQRRVEWFARVELSYSLGAPWRSARASEYLAARRDELATAPHEWPARAAALREDLRIQLASAERQRHLLEADAASIRATTTALDRGSIPAADHERASLAVEAYLVEGDLAFVSKLTETLSAMVGEPDVQAARASAR